MIDVNWKLKDGSIKPTRVEVGTNIMWAARFNDIGKREWSIIYYTTHSQYRTI